MRPLAERVPDVGNIVVLEDRRRQTPYLPDVGLAPPLVEFPATSDEPAGITVSLARLYAFGLICGGVGWCFGAFMLSLLVAEAIGKRCVAPQAFGRSAIAGLPVPPILASFSLREPQP